MGKTHLKITSLLVVGCCLGLLFAPQMAAQVLDPTTLHFNCTGTTSCAVGGTSFVVSAGSNPPTFTITTQSNSGLSPGQSGELYMLVMVPTGNPPLTFTVNGISGVVSVANYTSGQLEDVGNMNLTLTATSNPDFNAFASASGQGGTTPGGLTVYTINLGTVTAPTSVQNPPKGGFANGAVLATIGIGGISTPLPTGTVLYAMLAGAPSTSGTPNGQNIINTSPLSESLTQVPEGGSLAIWLCSGAAIFGSMWRRYV